MFLLGGLSQNRTCSICSQYFPNPRCAPAAYMFREKPRVHPLDGKGFLHRPRWFILRWVPVASPRPLALHPRKGTRRWTLPRLATARAYGLVRPLAALSDSGDRRALAQQPAGTRSLGAQPQPAHKGQAVVSLLRAPRPRANRGVGHHPEDAKRHHPVLLRLLSPLSRLLPPPALPPPCRPGVTIRRLAGQPTRTQTFWPSTENSQKLHNPKMPPIAAQPKPSRAILSPLPGPGLE